MGDLVGRLRLALVHGVDVVLVQRASAASTATRGSGSSGAATTPSWLPNWNSSLSVAASQRAPATIASKTRRIGTPGASRSPSSPMPMRMTPVPTTPATAASGEATAAPSRPPALRSPSDESTDGLPPARWRNPTTASITSTIPRPMRSGAGACASSSSSAALVIEVVGAETLGPVPGEQQHREAEARKREGDPSPAEHGGAAVGEEAAYRSGKIGAEPEHREHADDDERDRECVGAVAP